MAKKNKLLKNINKRLKELFPGIKLNLKFHGHRHHIILAAAGLLLIYSFFSGATGFVHIAKLHIEKNRLISENQKLLAELVDAEIIKKRLINDKNFIEYIARTQHYLSRPGEVIYRFKK